MGSIGQNSTQTCVAYLIKESHRCTNMAAKILPADPIPPPQPPLHPGDEVNGSLNFVAYLIKESHGCTNMAANILPADSIPPPFHPGDEVNRSKFNFIRHVLHILLKKVTNALTWQQIFCPQIPYPPPPPLWA